MPASPQPAIDAAAIDPQEAARNVARLSDDQLREGMSGPYRRQILDEIFRRMQEHFRPDAAAGLDAVIHWRITGRKDGGHDAYEVAIREDSCEVRHELVADPRVAFELDGVEFLRLVTGNVAGPTLFMSGQLKIEGDLMFASSIAGLFHLPS